MLKSDEERLKKIIALWNLLDTEVKKRCITREQLLGEMNTEN